MVANNADLVAEMRRRFLNFGHVNRNVIRDEAWYSVNWLNQSVCGNKEWFADIKQVDKFFLCVSDCNKGVQVQWVGSIKLEACVSGVWQTLKLDDVAYIPGAQNLISQPALQAKGIAVTHKKGIIAYTLPGTRQKLGYSIEDGLVNFKFRPLYNKLPLNVSASFGSVVASKIWHNRFCHLNMELLEISVKAKLIDFGDDILCSNIECDDCKTDALQLHQIKSDMKPGDSIKIYCYDHEISSINGQLFSVFAQDEATGFYWHCAKPKQKYASSFVRELVSSLQKHLNMKVKCLKMGNLYSDIVDSGFKKFAKKNKIVLEKSSIDQDTSIANLISMMKKNIKIAKLPPTIWEHVLDAIVQIANMTIGKPCIFTNPLAECLENKADVTNMRIIGAPAYADRNPKETFEDKKKIKGVVVGFGESGLKIYDASSNCVYTRKNVVVFEEAYLKDLLNIAKTEYSEEVKPSAPPLNMQIVPYEIPSKVILDTEIVHTTLQILKYSNDIQSMATALEKLDKYLCSFEYDCRQAEIVTSDDIIKLKVSKAFSGFELTARKEFTIVHATKDGNCMFHAISMLFFGSQKFSGLLRLVLLRHMLQHWSKFSKILPNISEKSMFDLANVCKTNEAWGTEVMLLMFSEIFARPFCVHVFKRRAGNIEVHFINSNPQNINRQWAFLNITDEHFEAMIPKSKNGYTSINLSNCVNLYAQVNHLYEYSADNLIDTQVTPLTAFSKNPSNDAPARSLALIDLTEDNRILECANCYDCELRLADWELRCKAAESINVRLKEELSSTIEAHKKSRCVNCTNLEEKLQKSLMDNEVLRDTNNRYSNWLSVTVDNLQKHNQALSLQVSNLTEGHNQMQLVLASKGNENHGLQQDLVVLAAEIDRLRQNKRVSPPLSISDFIITEQMASRPPTPATPAHLMKRTVPNQQQMLLNRRVEILKDSQFKSLNVPPRLDCRRVSTSSANASQSSRICRQTVQNEEPETIDQNKLIQDLALSQSSSCVSSISKKIYPVMDGSRRVSTANDHDSLSSQISYGSMLSSFNKYQTISLPSENILEPSGPVVQNQGPQTNAQNKLLQDLGLTLSEDSSSASNVSDNVYPVAKLGAIKKEILDMPPLDSVPVTSYRSCVKLETLSQSSDESSNEDAKKPTPGQGLYPVLEESELVLEEKGAVDNMIKAEPAYCESSDFETENNDTPPFCVKKRRARKLETDSDSGSGTTTPKEKPEPPPVKFRIVSKVPETKKNVKEPNQRYRIPKVLTKPKRGEPTVNQIDLKPKQRVEKEKKFQCPQCDVAPYTTKNSMERHIEYSHSRNTTRHTCQCGKSYKRYDGLQKHVLKKHKTSTGPFKCRWCPKTLKSKKCMQNHEMREHYRQFYNTLPSSDSESESE